MNRKRVILNILLYPVLFSIMLLNSITIVEWLNSSLFVDYAISFEEASNNYYVEVLLVFLIALLTNAVIGPLIIADYIKVQRSYLLCEKACYEDETYRL